ncbi:MAG: P-loop NTPase fold protein, partial [Nocardioides sp.]
MTDTHSDGWPSEPLHQIKAGSGGTVLAVALGNISDEIGVVVSGCGDGTVRRWDATTGEAIGGPLIGHAGPVEAIALGCVDGRDLIVSGSDDATVRRWDAATGEAIGQPLTGHTGVVWSVSHDTVSGKEIIVSAGGDGTVRRWDAATGEAIGQPLTGHTGAVWSVRLGGVGGRKMIVSAGGDDGTLRRWDAATGEAIGQPLTGHTGRVWSVAMGSADSRDVIVSAGGEDGTIRRWDATTGRPIGIPLVGHTDGVVSVALDSIAGGQNVIVSGSEDGTVQRWDAATGKPIGIPLIGHTSAVLGIALGSVDDLDVIVSAGGEDGTIRRWDAATGRPIGIPLVGHTDGVVSVTLGNIAGGREIILSGGGDETVRRWDAATGKPIGIPLIGHTGAVVSVGIGAVGRRAVIVSAGGEDGTIRRWDATTGEAIGQPLTGHTGAVISVAMGAVGRSTVVISAGGEDGTIRRWDATTGEAIGQPLTGHTGAVISVAMGTVDGLDVIVSAGGEDGTIRRWDATTGEPIGIPLIGHADRVVSVAMGTVGGQEVIVSSGLDGDVTIWEASSRTGGLRRPDPRVTDLAVADIERTQDQLRREVLAAYLDRLLDRVSRTDEERQRAVFHLDGSWGSGKSTLIELVLDPDLSGIQPPPRRHISDPLVVRYDAWRESTVAPEWWSLATTLHREVRSTRSFPTQLLMSVVDISTRLARARSSLVAVAALGILALGRWMGWWTSLEVAGDTLAVLIAVLAFGATAGRLLFWLSPVFGNLHSQSDDNPLAEIAAAVTRLRRWVPRCTGAQLIADTTLAAGLVLTVLWWANVVDDGSAVSPRLSTLGHGISSWLIPLTATGITVALAAPLAIRKGHRRQSLPRIAATVQTAELGSATNWFTARPMVIYLAPIVVAVAIIYSTPTPTLLATHATTIAIAMFAAQLAGFGWWTAKLTLSARRRPILLVIDDLDRCPANRVVKLLETVHTLMRESDRARRLTQWRRPASLLVVVAADGRWVRRAFSTTYADFAPLGSAVHGLGSDFIQKLFDHTVLIPALSAQQVVDYIEAVSKDESTDSSPATPVATVKPPAITDAHFDLIKDEIATSTAEQLQSPQLTRKIRSIA